MMAVDHEVIWENMENTENIEKMENFNQMTQNSLFMILNTLFMTQTLFYGINDDG